MNGHGQTAPADPTRDPATIAARNEELRIRDAAESRGSSGSGGVGAYDGVYGEQPKAKTASVGYVGERAENQRSPSTMGTHRAGLLDEISMLQAYHRQSVIDRDQAMTNLELLGQLRELLDKHPDVARMFQLMRRLGIRL